MTWRPWSDLSPTERRRRSEEACFATLKRRPATPSAHALLSVLMDRYVLPAKLKDRKSALGPGSRDKLEAALGAIVADVLVQASRGFAVKLSVRKEAFTGRSISRTAFADVMGPLVAAGLVEHVPGFKDAAGSVKAPLYMATPALVGLVHEHGLTERVGFEHFPEPNSL